MIKFKESNIKQTAFFDSKRIYDEVIPKDNILRKIKNNIDFSFVDKELSTLYSPLGQHAIAPSLLLKVSWLQWYYGGLSDRKIMERAATDLVVKYFLGVRIDEKLFHFSALERFREDVGANRLEKLFNKINKQLKKRGVFSNTDVRYMDASHQLADVAKLSVLSLLERASEYLMAMCWAYSPFELEKEYDFSVMEIHLSEGKRKKRFLALVDYSRALLKYAEKLLEKEDQTNSKYACVQKAYLDVKRIINERTVKDDEGNHKRKNNPKITGKLASLTDKDATWGSKSKDFQFLGYKLNMTFTDTEFIEHVSAHQGHKPDEQMFPKDCNKIKSLSPSVIKIITDTKYGTIANRIFAILSGITLVAPTWKGMKAHLSSIIMDKALMYQYEEEYNEEMKKRGHLEGKFGEAKTQHHFHRAKYRGLPKVKFQAIMIAMVCNLKRFANLIAT